MEDIERIFGDKVIALNAASDLQRWPARSPNLTICDLYLWGALKENFYETLVGDLEEVR